MRNNDYKEYLKTIGERVKRYRVSAGMTQQDLADNSGVSIRSISRLEQGASVQMESLIRILCALNLDDNLNLLVPDQSKRPSYYLLRDSGKGMQRVRKKSDHSGKFKWGDET